MRGHHQRTALPVPLHSTFYGLLGSQILISILLIDVLPIWVPLIAIAGYLLCALILYRGWSLPTPIVLVGLGGMAMIGIGLQFHTLNGAPAGVSLLQLIAAIKTLETRTRRDLIVGVLITLLLTSSIFLFGQGIARSVIALLNLVWLVATLQRINDSDDPHTRLPVIHELRRACLRSIAALPMMLLLFILFPRIEGPLWGNGATNRHQGITGLSDRMSPGSFSHLVRSQAVAFRAHLADAPPPDRTRYWRAYVLNRFNGVTWLPPSHPDKPSAHLERLGPPIRYTLLIQGTGQHGLPILGFPISAPPGTRLITGYTLRANHAIDSLHSYHLKVVLDPSHLGGSIGRPQLLNDLLLPRGYAPEARALVRSWHKQDSQPQALITSALRFFHDQDFFYTLNPPRLRGDITDQFLFGTRQGYCEDYASAFAVLMRLGGIPARIVVGYFGGTWNASLHYFTVRESDAHAWVEVWLKHQGWVRIDPTAAVAPSRVEANIADIGNGGLGARQSSIDWLSHWTRSLNTDWDNASYLWETWVVAFGPSAQRALLHRLGLGSDWISMAINLAVGFGALAVIGFIWTYWQQRPPSPDPAQRLYQSHLRRLRRQGLIPRTTEGALEFARRVALQCPEWAEQAFNVARCYHEARYAPATSISSRQRLARLRSAILAAKVTIETKTPV